MSSLWPWYAAALFFFVAGLLWHKRRAMVLGVGWFLLGFGMRIPAIILGQAVFDKWISFASIGILSLAAVGITGKLERSRGPFRILWAALVVLLIGGWGMLSVWNIRLRGSDEKNYQWAMRHEFRDFAAYRLSVIYLKTGRSEVAIPYLETMLERDPQNPDVKNTLAMARWHHGERSRAVADLKALLKENADYAPARENLALMLSGRFSH
jgi:tetratricopeptide (TPR) repeat protein